MEWSTIQPILDETSFEPRTYQKRIIEKCINMFLGETKAVMELLNHLYDQ